MQLRGAADCDGVATPRRTAQKVEDGARSHDLDAVERDHLVARLEGGGRPAGADRLDAHAPARDGGQPAGRTPARLERLVGAARRVGEHQREEDAAENETRAQRHHPCPEAVKNKLETR